MLKSLPKILIIFFLGIFSVSLIVKCNSAALVKVECHSDDCEQETESSNNSDCSHCITLKNVINSSLIPENNFSYKPVLYTYAVSDYDFFNLHMVYHPPRS